MAFRAGAFRMRERERAHATQVCGRDFDPREPVLATQFLFISDPTCRSSVGGYRDHQQNRKLVRYRSWPLALEVYPAAAEPQLRNPPSVRPARGLPVHAVESPDSARSKAPELKVEAAACADRSLVLFKLP